MKDLFSEVHGLEGYCKRCQRTVFTGEPHSHLDRDVTANLHQGAETSQAAHSSTTDQRRNEMRLAILGCIDRAENGATCDEVEVWTGFSHQTASARISEMLRDGTIIDSGIRRPTRSGREARVYAVKG